MFLITESAKHDMRVAFKRRDKVFLSLFATVSSATTK